METNGIEDLLSQLEALTDEVLSCLVRGETANLIELVSEQCACVHKFAGQVSEEQAEHLREIVQRVSLQQQLVEQGLRISRTFLGRVYQRGGFQSWA
ncbi:hypothetical protein [Alicyclobacillus mali (ex Roth et al. 2021)]|uniref:hypothetical protein n=1 Tax=Alicyclobacillus mali (ex Roth et al. 2021) TaxID=1123961 RepID=UPI001F5CCEF6|nr:hypothetical protein [Alicyclobacillus mali (ex Roth et al. 2021)]